MTCRVYNNHFYLYLLSQLTLTYTLQHVLLIQILVRETHTEKSKKSIVNAHKRELSKRNNGNHDEKIVCHPTLKSQTTRCKHLDTQTITTKSHNRIVNFQVKPLKSTLQIHARKPDDSEGGCRLKTVLGGIMIQTSTRGHGAIIRHGSS